MEEESKGGSVAKPLEGIPTLTQWSRRRKLCKGRTGEREGECRGGEGIDG